jgi:hypothetical protein
MTSIGGIDVEVGIILKYNLRKYDVGIVAEFM